MATLTSLTDWVLLSLGIVASCELFLRFPISGALTDAEQLLRTRLPRLRSSRISDHWKAQVSRAYAAKLFRLTTKLTLFVLIGLLPALAVLWFVEGSIKSAIKLSMSIGFLAAAAGFSVVYLLIRSWVRSHA